MPIIPPYLPTGAQLDPDDLYDSSLYDPTGATETPHTMEVLNGGLDRDNYIYTAENKLQAWQIQEGAFFRGYYTGFDRPEFCSKQQTGNKDIEENWIDHPGMAQKFFLPWDASVVMYGFQGFFRQDCTVWETNSPLNPGDSVPHLFKEAWYLQATVDNDTKTSLAVKLPYTRITGATDSSDQFLATADGWTNFWDNGGLFDDHWEPRIGASNYSGMNGVPGIRLPKDLSNPRRWRWVSKQGMLKGLTKGYHDFRVRVWVNALDPRPDYEEGAKLNSLMTHRGAGSSGEGAEVGRTTDDGTSPPTATDASANLWIVPVPECKLTTMSGAIWIMAMR